MTEPVPVGEMPEKGMNRAPSQHMSICAADYRTFTAEPPAWRAGHGEFIPVESMDDIHVRKVLEQTEARSRSLARNFLWGMRYLHPEKADRLRELCTIYFEDGPYEVLRTTPLIRALEARRG